MRYYAAWVYVMISVGRAMGRAGTCPTAFRSPEFQGFYDMGYRRGRKEGK